METAVEAPVVAPVVKKKRTPSKFSQERAAWVQESRNDFMRAGGTDTDLKTFTTGLKKLKLRPFRKMTPKLRREYAINAANELQREVPKFPPIVRHAKSSQLAGAKRPTSAYQGKDVDEPEAVELAMAMSLADMPQPSTPPDGPESL